MNTYVQEINDYIDRHREEMLEFWKTLVNMQAYSKETDGVNQVIHFLKEKFEEEGMTCTLVDSQGNADVLIAEDGIERPGRPVILSGHVDTVFPRGSFPENPFRIEKDTAYGPGVIDMKGGIVIMLYVVKALKRLGFQKRPVRIILCGDEEIGHAGSISDKIIVQKAKGALCAFNLEIGRPDNCLSVGRKGGVDCHVTVTGVASHVGNDFLKGRNAIAEMAYKIPLFQQLTEYEKGIVVSVNVIRGGTVSNTIPDTCTAELDIRFNKVADQEIVCRKIKEICEKTFIEGTETKAEFVSCIPAFEDRRENRELLAYVNRTAEKMGYEPMGAVFLGGNSDASFLAIAGVPTVCSFGVKGTGAHTKKECAFVPSLFERAKLIAAAVENLDIYEKERVKDEDELKEE